MLKLGAVVGLVIGVFAVATGAPWWVLPLIVAGSALLAVMTP